MGESRTSRWRPGPRTGVLLCLGALVAGELALRGLGYRPRLGSVPDPHFGWVLLPDQRAWQDGRAVRTNGDGFYDAEWPEGERASVAVLGSSFSVGPWVAEDARWPDLVEAELGPGAVMNLAVSGYGIEQMRRVYDAHLAHRAPEVLVVELSDASVLPAVTPADRSSRFYPWLVRSALYDAWCRYVTRDRGAEAAPDQGDAETESRRALRRSFSRDPHGPIQEELWLAMEAHLEHLIDAQAARGGRVVVFAAPLSTHDEGVMRTRPAEWLARRPVAERVTLIDPIGSFRRSDGSIDADLYCDEDPLHWSEEGHQRVAAALLVELLR